MKKLIVLSLLTAAFAQASEPFNMETDFKWSGQKKFSNPTVEIRNRDKYPLNIIVVNGENKQEFIIPANTSSFFESKVPVARLTGLDKTKGTNLYFWFEPTDYDAPRSITSVGYKQHVYFIKPGKDIFVSWEKGNLRPQKGSSGKTQSGLSLKNNLSLKELNMNKSESVNPSHGRSTIDMISGTK